MKSTYMHPGLKAFYKGFLSRMETSLMGFMHGAA
jgi:hypothetical protein